MSMDSRVGYNKFFVVFMMGFIFIAFCGVGYTKKSKPSSSTSFPIKESNQNTSIESTNNITVYSSYSASFLPVKNLLYFMQKESNSTNPDYNRSYALFRSVSESKYRTKKYSDLRRQYDNLVSQQEKLGKQEKQLQNQLNQTVYNQRGAYNGRRSRNTNNFDQSYNINKQYLNTQINSYRTQISNLHSQEQNIYVQMIQEQLGMYQRALGDEAYLKSFLEEYALSGVKKARQQELLRDQLKAREEERKAASEWQAWVTFDYLSKYSTLKESLERKEITFDQYEKQRDKLDKEKLDKLKQSQKEGREAFKETYERLTTAVDTSKPTPDF